MANFSRRLDEALNHGGVNGDDFIRFTSAIATSAALDKIPVALQRAQQLPPEQLAQIDTAIANEVQQILRARGFYKGVVNGVCDAELLRALRDFMGWENYDERIRDDDLIDLEVLADIRVKHAAWLQAQVHAA